MRHWSARFECGQLALTAAKSNSRLKFMVVNLKPETESRLRELSATTGRAADELVEDAMSGYLTELAETRDMLDTRYDQIKNGSVQTVDGEAAFAQLRKKNLDR